MKHGWCDFTLPQECGVDISKITFNSRCKGERLRTERGALQRATQTHLIWINTWYYGDYDGFRLALGWQTVSDPARSQRDMEIWSLLFSKELEVVWSRLAVINDWLFSINFSSQFLKMSKYLATIMSCAENSCSISFCCVKYFLLLILSLKHFLFLFQNSQ